MARLEIPSIVVHNGSNSAPGSPKMRAQRTLSRQAEVEELDDEQSPVPSEEALGAEKSDPVGAEKSDPDSAEAAPPPSRSRTNSKVKLLVRSHALPEEASPPPDPDAQPEEVEEAEEADEEQQQEQQEQQQEQQEQQQQPPAEEGGGAEPAAAAAPAPAAAVVTVTTIAASDAPQEGASLTVTRPASRHKVRRQGSNDGSSPSLSRGSSNEYTDSTGVDLQQFIRDTLNKNHKDRMLLLKIEHEMLNLTKDNKRTHHKFPPMSSYQRMLVHRVAAYFGMEHNVDPTGCSVIVNKTKSTRVPEMKFREHLREDLLFPEEPRRSILKRDSSSFEDCNSMKSPERQFSSESRRSKSFEEREEEYEKARKRIFHTNNSSLRSSQEDFPWPSDIQQWSSSDSGTSNHLRANLLHERDRRHTRLLKVESFEGRDTLKANSLRLAVSKSYSFGGYPVSTTVGEESQFSSSSSRLLTKQDSGSSSMSSRLSPSSSGYKSQSQRSDATLSATPSPTATPAAQFTSVASPVNACLCIPVVEYSEIFKKTEPPAPQAQNILEDPNAEPVMWAVSDLSSIPPGSILINHQTLEAYTNPDGSVYRFDPQNPPKVVREEHSIRLSKEISPEPEADNQPDKGSDKKTEKSITESEQPPKRSSPVLRTTATSPSLPETQSTDHSPTTTTEQQLNTAPSQVTSVSQAPNLVHPQLMAVCHSGPCPYVTVQPDQSLFFHNTPQFLPPVGMQSGEVYGTPTANQNVTPCPLQSSPLLYTSYPVPVPGGASGVNAVYDTRLLDGGTVTELHPGMLGLSLSDQRPNGESTQQTSLATHGHTYQGPNSYWQQQLPAPFQPTAQAMSNMPLFYVPSSPTNNIVSSSLPHHGTVATSGNGSHRFMAYPGVQPFTSNHQQSTVSNLNATGPSADSSLTSTSSCPVVNYGSVPSSGAGDAVSMCTQPAVHMLYTSPPMNPLNTVTSGGTHVTSTATVPYYASAPSVAVPSFISSGQAAFHTPTPPGTPPQNQGMCNVAATPFFYLSGAPNYSPLQQAPGLTPMTHPPAPPSGSIAANGHYLSPMMPNMGIFRPNMQMSSPPRPVRDNVPVRSPLCRGPAPKERTATDKSPAMHYPTVPVFGVRFVPGVVRGSCPSAMRMPLSGNNIAHRLPNPNVQRNPSEGSPNSGTRAQKPRKQR